MIAEHADTLARLTQVVEPMGFQLVSDGERLARLMRQDGWEIRFVAEGPGYSIELCKAGGGQSHYLPLDQLMKAFEARIGKDWAKPTLPNQLWFLKAFTDEICAAAEAVTTKPGKADAA